jgi:hypothetical protein
MARYFVAADVRRLKRICRDKLEPRHLGCYGSENRAGRAGGRGAGIGRQTSPRIVAVAEKSQRDFIIQPSVAPTKEGLRWVVNDKMTSTPKELNRYARNGDATALRLENFLGTVDPG